MSAIPPSRVAPALILGLDGGQRGLQRNTIPNAVQSDLGDWVQGRLMLRLQRPAR
jgi:hypothetical protein